ncbi:MAG TPA: polysaccharide biosynthesis C-terminal domain-containing protein, partial [Acidimicrobiales bacterium]|nr:polysaccharide biosynthesis C-terminal domain-containing protein [Acidimicrobiales bacterium]
PMYLNIMLSQVLVAAKRQVVWTWVMAGATVINPLLNVVLIRATEARYHNGAIGAAISLLVTELLIVSVGFIMVGRDVLEARSMWRGLRTATASFAMWGVAYAARSLGTLPSLAAGAFTFLLLAVLLRLATPEEIVLMRLQAVRIAQRLPIFGARATRSRVLAQAGPARGAE